MYFLVSLSMQTGSRTLYGCNKRISEEWYIHIGHIGVTNRACCVWWPLCYNGILLLVVSELFSLVHRHVYPLPSPSLLQWQRHRFTFIITYIGRSYKQFTIVLHVFILSHLYFCGYSCRPICLIIFKCCPGFFISFHPHWHFALVLFLTRPIFLMFSSPLPYALGRCNIYVV